MIPGSTATATLEVRNPSTVVDGYVFAPVDPPPWLLVTHDDAHLMPGEARTVTVAFGTRPGGMIVAQRLQMTLAVRSEDNPAMATEVEVAITVPPQGPTASMEVTPSLLRLDDVALGSFRVRLDNRLANYPQRFALRGRDPEKAVQFSFSPSIVEVGPGQLVEVDGLFTVPPIRHGEELSRQLTILAVNDATEITAIVTLLQRRSPAEPFVPIGLELAPSRLSMIDDSIADFDVRIDNRNGSTPRTLDLHGRDPEDRARFAFTPAHVVVPARGEVVVRGRISVTPPPAGESRSVSFSVVTSDEGRDVEAPGTVEVTSSPPALRTATLQMEPAVLNIRGARSGAFRLQIDNRRSARPLDVALAGHSSDGAVEFRFVPPHTRVEPHSVGSVRVEVEAARTPASETRAAQLVITARTDEGAIEASATLVQSRTDRRPIAKVILVLLGSALMAIGTFSPWIAGDRYGEFIGMLSSPNWSDVPLLVAAGAHVLILLVVLGALFGLTGRSGRLIRVSAVFGLLVAVGFAVYTFVASGGPENGGSVELVTGFFLVCAGAVLAYIGGLFARPRH
ncbi:hypothetical protein [Microbacterium sp. BK668]|uniref:hypothetical protein n=1 Tax=Microbacterium sp. BK668 TaxID=2512118 RepID=UPI00105E2593|nr:hypothetical protein [Microbacterium sp. BK668]TDN87745.1 hypothetical protein EV279_3178 [Microbacterium sp. BK668]